MNISVKTLANGLVKENPVLIIMLGLCPVLACSQTAKDALGMGLATLFVLVSSNILVSMLRKWTPQEIRIPAFIIIAATFVTLTDYVVRGYFPALSRSLGVFIPLIVVNCIILGRAEVFAYKNTVWLSALDGLGMGIGFTLVIVILGLLREILGAGTFFEHQLGLSNTASLMILPPGAFIGMGVLIIIYRLITKTGANPDTRCSCCDLSQLCHPAGRAKCDLMKEKQ